MPNALINGRTAVHAGSQGALTTIDVCWTKVGKPSIPIPYTNIARSADAAKTASTVFINGNPVCLKDSIFAKSTGDQPGIKSGTITQKAEFVTASSNVFIEGVAAVRQGDLMVSNNANTHPHATDAAGRFKAAGEQRRRGGGDGRARAAKPANCLHRRQLDQQQSPTLFVG